jgi:predicted O-linked N-acetylglucosamine transferase (SPINDLY family)
VFARRPAPVQVTYLGYPNTTGLPGIDYRLTDAHADPPSRTEALHTEELVRLPRCFLCYAPPNNPPDVAVAPFAREGCITFGSCSKSLKWNRSVFGAWAAILARVPGSRLLLHHSSGGRNGLTARVQAELRTRVCEEFLSFGISPDRIGMLGSVDWPSHWNWYHHVDLALDPFPYNGTTATCETLWMGVPVVALEGVSHVSRVGVSILRTLGLDCLVAGSIEQYVETAVRLAGNPAELAELRGGMRHRMRSSPLMDGPSFTASLEDAYRAMWRRWVEADSREPTA